MNRRNEYGSTIDLHGRRDTDENRLLDITGDAPSNLFFSTMSEKLHSGLEQQIERFLAAHPDTALNVIDTLQRIRGGVNDANPYASDYWRKPYDWHAVSIRVILNNPVCLGKVVYGRSKTKEFFDKRREKVPEDE